jgi:hypothetical protein
MSLFDQTTGQEANQTSGNQTNEDWLAKVVETKGESFKDVQVLAKSKLESDRFIRELETQLAQMREELGKQDYASKLLDQLQNKAPTPTGGNSAMSKENTGGTNTSDTKPVVSEETLKALVEQTLTQREKESTAKQNTAAVAQQLAQKYGTEAKTVVEQKAQALGMSLNRLEELAAESPNAFFALIGEPQTTIQPIVKGSINTQSVSMQAPVDRDWNYYQKLRRENKSLYYSPKTQQQLMQDKMRLGDKFGNT